jgi:hypothetical protein
VLYPEDKGLWTGEWPHSFYSELFGRFADLEQNDGPDFQNKKNVF